MLKRQKQQDSKAQNLPAGVARESGEGTEDAWEEGA